MDRGTMEYISRRTERQNRRSEEVRQNEPDIYPEYESGRISNRYGEYRMGGNQSSERKEKHQIGFMSEHDNKPKDILYELEECFECEIDDIVYYCEMAMEAEMKGHREFSSAFYELAKEKLACAEFIRLRLIQHGEYDPHKQKEIEERFDRAKHLFKRL